MRPADTIVVGGSAGALSVLQQIVQDFPDNFPASIFVVAPRAKCPTNCGEVEAVDYAEPLSGARFAVRVRKALKQSRKSMSSFGGAG
jgi:hypothetical protein